MSSAVALGRAAGHVLAARGAAGRPCAGACAHAHAHACVYARGRAQGRAWPMPCTRAGMCWWVAMAMALEPAGQGRAECFARARRPPTTGTAYAFRYAAAIGQAWWTMAARDAPLPVAELALFKQAQCPAHTHAPIQTAWVYVHIHTNARTRAHAHQHTMHMQIPYPLAPLRTGVCAYGAPARVPLPAPFPNPNPLRSSSPCTGRLRPLQRGQGRAAGQGQGQHGLMARRAGSRSASRRRRGEEVTVTVLTGAASCCAPPHRRTEGRRAALLQGCREEGDVGAAATRRRRRRCSGRFVRRWLRRFMTRVSRCLWRCGRGPRRPQRQRQRQRAGPAAAGAVQRQQSLGWCLITTHTMADLWASGPGGGAPGAGRSCGVVWSGVVCWVVPSVDLVRTPPGHPDTPGTNPIQSNPSAHPGPTQHLPRCRDASMPACAPLVHTAFRHCNARTHALLPPHTHTHTHM